MNNEYSQTIELDFTPHRCYRVLKVTAVEAARPYIRLDCEHQ